MRQFANPLIILVMLAANAFAQSPTIDIIGPTGGVPGDLLVLSIESDTATHVAWTVTPELPDGRVTLLPIEQSRKAILCSVPGTWTVICAASSDTGIAIKKHVVVVSGDGQPVKPQPIVPRPQPQPDSKYGLDRQVAGWLSSVDVKGDEHKRLAFNLESIAGRIDRGELTKLDGAGSIQEATFNGNRDVLQTESDRQRWLPFFVEQQKALKSLSESGRMSTAADYAIAWREIAKGLKGGAQ